MRANLRASGLLTLAAVVLSWGSATDSALAARAPSSFSVTLTGRWSTIEMRSDIEYKRAWDTVFDILVKSFDVKIALREDGYILTDWNYAWSGDYMEKYRVRITIKFSPDKANLQYLPEAQFLDGNRWLIGTDTRLVSTFRTDLMGTVGRTTR